MQNLAIHQKQTMVGKINLKKKIHMLTVCV